MVQQTGKNVAYLQLNKIVNDLVRKVTWAQLHKNSITRIARSFHKRIATG